MTHTQNITHKRRENHHDRLISEFQAENNISSSYTEYQINIQSKKTSDEPNLYICYVSVFVTIFTSKDSQ